MYPGVCLICVFPSLDLIADVFIRPLERGRGLINGAITFRI